jgi:hypothetical protein
MFARTVRTHVLLMVMLVGLLLAPLAPGHTPAGAAAASLSISPTAGPPGTTVTVTGSGGIHSAAAAPAPGIVLYQAPGTVLAPPTRPVFVYPAARQTIPYSGSWSFAVRPMKGARGYLWSFVQDGVIRWQNLTFEHRLSGRTYTIASGNTAHRHLHPGWLWVWVQALLSHERWSGVTTLTVILRTPPAPMATPTPEPVDTPTPEPTSPPAAPTPGQTLYTADWSNGFNGWTTSQDWKTVSGQLVNDGTNGDATQFAHAPMITPYTPNYAVEAEIQSVRDGHGCSSYGAFGLSVRGESIGDYRVGILGWGTAFIFDHTSSDGCPEYYYNALTTAKYSLDTDWHTYRVEVRGNDFKILIDGQSVIETTDNHHLTSNSVGLWSNGRVINVRSFKVIAL